ncbi:ArsA family ATPase [Blastococcus sp. TF02A-30]|uniref:ArsA family ATPase n=1 Tax=Blastococcus sp. TF02A-30 TaxID=2250580 RepID=UPI000DEA4BAB|nr:ArsA family ATPase [Blastococcus sp. TF02A-30]RBY85525.1 ion transporter [Blastococcus sp. TF02A-30]
MRTLLVAGPGGAGTSTSAAAAAVRAARDGRATVLLTRRAPDVAGLGAVPGLQVRTVDPRASVEEFWGGTVVPSAAGLPLTLPPASSVVPLPGAAELALLAELGRVEADLVVVDAGSTTDLVGLVALPSTLRWWLDRLLPPGIRALGAVRTAAVAAGAARRGPADAGLALVRRIESLLASDRLAPDPPGPATGTAVLLTAVPRAGTAPALRPLVTALGLHGVRPGAVLARVLPAEGTGEWWRRRTAEQESALAELAVLAPVHAVEEGAEVPRDADALAALLDGFELPAATALPAPATERAGGGWRLSVPLPFAERGAVQLTRWEDDLVVDAAGTRRSLPLDSLLRRCEVTGGSLVDAGTADARLEVAFRPDPTLWPADLLAAERRNR